MKTDYEKKLEKRIHNQRVRLRELEGFSTNHKEHYRHLLRPRWMAKVFVLKKEIRKLNAHIKILTQPFK